MFDEEDFSYERKESICPPYDMLSNTVKVEVVHIYLFEFISKGGSQVFVNLSRVANCTSCIVQPCQDH